MNSTRAKIALTAAMRPLRVVVFAMGFSCVSVAAGASSRPGKAEILEIARAQVATLPWGSDASLAITTGAGGILSRWVVVATCARCDVGADEGILVIGFDREGRVLCAVPVGTFVCGDHDKLDGAEASQRLRATDARKNRVEIVERYRSGGARILSVRVLGKPASD